jgi:hypothetical protein
MGGIILSTCHIACGEFFQAANDSKPFDKPPTVSDFSTRFMVLALVVLIPAIYLIIDKVRSRNRNEK